MGNSTESFAARTLHALAKSIHAHRAFYIWPQFLLFAFCVYYTVANLKFNTSRNDLVGSDKKYHQIFLQFKKEFPTQDDLVVVVESEDLEKNRQFVERLAAKLEMETNLFADVFYKGDLKMLGPKALLFVPEDQLKELQKTLREYQPFVLQFTRATNLVSLFSLINRQFLYAPEEETPETLAMVKALPALERIISQGTESLKRTGVPPSPGVNALFGSGDEAEKEIYITFANGRIYLATARARTEQQNGEAVERLRQIVAQTQTEIPGLNVGLTGEPVLEVDEMAQSQTDSTIATIVSLIVCAGIFIYGYRQFRRPMKATLCLIVGLGYTMGFTTLAVGHLNILTITFVPILIGLAIDFGVHLITRFEEELGGAQTQFYAIEKAIVNTGRGIFTGAFTTAGAFFAMAFTDFKGIQEMGIICGGGMLLCLLPMMTLLPAILLKAEGQAQPISVKKPAIDRRAAIEQIWLSRPVTVAIIGVLLSAAAVWEFRKVYFDYNLLNMQSAGLPAVEFEKKLIDAASKSVLFGAVVADSIEEAVELEKRLEALPAVASVDSMSEYLSQNADQKLAIVRSIKKDLEPIRFAALDPAPVDILGLSSTLWSQEGYLGSAKKVVGTNNAQLSSQLHDLRTAIQAFRKQMLSDNPAVPERLQSFQRALFQDIHETFAALQGQDDRGQLTAADLPEPLRNRFIGISNKYLLQVYPKKDVWQRDNQEEFVEAIRTVAPNATGTPVQLFEYTTLLRTSYEKAAIYASIAIAILALVHFRSIVCVLLALVPVALGAIWMLGIMGWQDIPFNPANIMTLPLVAGIGVTNGIHILNRFAEEQNPGILGKSTGKAVLVSGLTTIAGFGSLIVAKHQGIASLGFVMSVGVTTCMIAGLAFLPAFLQLLTRAGWKIKKTQ